MTKKGKGLKGAQATAGNKCNYAIYVDRLKATGEKAPCNQFGTVSTGTVKDRTEVHALTEIVSRTLQVSSVFLGMFGDAIVQGCVVGERTHLHCKIDSRIMIDPPRPGEFWKMAGELYDDAVYGQQLRVSACEPVKLPEDKYVASLLVNHPAFKGLCFGQKKVAALLELFGPETLVKHLNDGNVYELSRAIQRAIAIEVVKAWQSLDNEVNTINQNRSC